ncbi:MAG TPA: SDR family NAD(P)-dependent oxidoreductase [Pyrinomonadaceae bacterium]|nr:SDR family NAD(P)-dependent oxidoreductase [Pyrinomonadaceae bacterium]
MREFKDRVAVVTGVASGIGRGLADACAREGMKVVLADAMLRELVEAGMRPSQVADMVFDAVREGRFYVLTHDDWKPLVRQRMNDIQLGRNPSWFDPH